ncbi:MAG: hypothetical protein NE330_07625 [Lentisphaeraceae bacterium]|nr:hypothetical protein [Lentisphaeraceae bacterium]
MSNLNQFYAGLVAPDYEAPSFLKNEPDDAFMSDHMSYNFAQKVHIKGHNISFIDGSAGWNGDKNLLFLNLTNNQHVDRENLFWKEVDR